MRESRQRRSGGKLALSIMIGLLFGGGGTALASPRSEEIAERLAGAIRFETVSPEDPAEFDPEPFVAFAAYLRDLYPRTHATLDLERINEHTLLFEWKGTNPDLAPALFMAHLDVVPVEGAAVEAWTHPPFAGEIVDGFVWGRGALDVKSGVIFWLEAIESLLAGGFTPERTIYLSLGHDEEIGGQHGAVAVAERFRSLGIHPAFLFDEGGLILDGHPLLPEATTALVITAEKSYYTVQLTAHGVSGHSSMPPKHTAIGKLARAIERVENHPMPAKIVRPLRDMLEAASPHVSLGRRFAFRNLWLTGGLVKKSFLEDQVSAPLVRTTFAVTLVSGGVKDNVIPERAQATINVRMLPGDTPEDVIEHLTRVIDDPEIEIEGTTWGMAPEPAPVDGIAFPLASEAIRSVYPQAIVLPGLISGATDSRHFTGIVDEIIRFVPERVHVSQADGAHGRDERIAVEYLADSVAIATGMVRRAGKPGLQEE
ncbi:MAG TPA: M20/M25/M40 family metallo-hydrolase [Deltaproteobacteria bacterium]|nr:M20/M25/M40 family metallo-hydrolase [Deltaproteobacteria bacterium]